MTCKAHYRLLVSILIGLGLGALSTSYPAQDRKGFIYPLGANTPAVKSANWHHKKLDALVEIDLREKRHA